MSVSLGSVLGPSKRGALLGETPGWRLPTRFNPNHDPASGQFAAGGGIAPDNSVAAAKAAKEWANSLSPEEKTAIYNYTQDGYRDINAVLRGDPPPHMFWQDDTEIRDNAEIVTDAVDSAPPLPPGTTLYRGLALNTVGGLGDDVTALGYRPSAWPAQQAIIDDWANDNLKPGTVISPAAGGLASFTTDGGDAAARFHRDLPNVLYEVPDAKTGAYIADVSKFTGEREVLVPEDQTYTVTGSRWVSNISSPTGYYNAAAVKIAPRLVVSLKENNVDGSRSRAAAPADSADGPDRFWQPFVAGVIV